MVDPYAHSQISSMNNGSNARLCEVVVTYCCQLRTIRARSLSARQLRLYETMCSRIPNSQGTGPHLKRYLQSLMHILIVP